MNQDSDVPIAYAQFFIAFESHLSCEAIVSRHEAGIHVSSTCANTRLFFS